MAKLLIKPVTPTGLGPAPERARQVQGTKRPGAKRATLGSPVKAQHAFALLSLILTGAKESAEPEGRQPLLPSRLRPPFVRGAGNKPTRALHTCCGRPEQTKLGVRSL